MALNANFWIVLVLALGLYFIWMDVALYYRLQVSIPTISSHALALIHSIVRPRKGLEKQRMVQLDWFA